MIDKDIVRQSVVAYIEDACLVSLKEQNITDKENLFEAGILDSYALIELLLYLEQQFSFRLTEAEIASSELSSIETICAIVVNKRCSELKVG